MKQFDSSLKLVAKSSFIVFIGLVLSKVFTYIYRVLVARYYGPEIYGLFSIAFMIVSWFVAFSSLGLSDGILRFISFYRGKKEINKVSYILRFSLIISIISSLFSGILLFFLSDFISLQIFHNQGLIIFLKIFSIIIPLWIISNIFLYTLRAYEKIFWYSFILNILDNGVKLLFLLIFIILGLKTNAVIFSFILGFFAMFLAAYMTCKYKIPEIFKKQTLKENDRKKIVYSLISYSWPLIFSLFLYLIFTWTDSFIIGYFKDATQVGIYNAAVPIAMLLNFTPDIFMQIFFPLIIKYFSQNKKEIVRDLSKQVGKWIFIINLPIFFFILIFPEAIINFLFGPEYISAALALRFLSIGFFISSTLRVSKFLVQMIGKSKLLLVNIASISILNLILDILLVPKHGLAGAAFATMISFISLDFMFFFQARYYTGIIPFRKKTILIVFISLIPLAFLMLFKYFIKSSLPLLILGGTSFILFYFLLILLFRGFDSNDIEILRSIKRKLQFNHPLK